MTISSITESMVEESKEEPVIVESQGAPETSTSHSPNQSMVQEEPFPQQQSRKHGSLSLQVPNITVAQFSERGSRRSSSSKHSSSNQSPARCTCKRLILICDSDPINAALQ